MKIDEFKERKNTHQTHFEDLVLLGQDGLEELNDKIDKFIGDLSSGSSQLNTTTKIDGAPAVVCWHKFPDYPDDSICLKSFVTSNKNCLSSKEDIQAKYGDRPDMAEKLMYCLEVARSIPDNEAWQGDCLYSQGDLKEREIHGTNYLTFHPNKIIYAFSEDNPTYETIKNSSFGICFHTIYKPAAEGKKTQSFRVDAKRLNNVPENIYVMSPALNKSTNKADYNLDEVANQYEELKKIEDQLLSNSDYEDLCDNSLFMGYWNTFENANLSDKQAVNIDVNTFFDELKVYIKNKQQKAYDKKMSNLKSDAGRQKATDAYNNEVIEIEDILDTNKEVIVLLVKALNLAANIKMNLWNGFKKSEQGYNTFYKSKSKGYIPADMEGVAMSDQDGNIVKVVDRSTFSFANRSDDIESGFEHPNEGLEEEADWVKNTINTVQNTDKDPAVKATKDYHNKKLKKPMKGAVVSSTPGLIGEDMNEDKRYIAPIKDTADALDCDPELLETGPMSKGRTPIYSKANGATVAYVRASNGHVSLTGQPVESLEEDYKVNIIYKDKYGKTSSVLNVDYRRMSEIRKALKADGYTVVGTEPVEESLNEDTNKYIITYGNLEGIYIVARVNNIEDALIKADEADEKVMDPDEEEVNIFCPDGKVLDAEGNELEGYNDFTYEEILNVPELYGESLNEEAGKTAVMAFGRMNPPTVGHEKLINTMAEAANKYNADAKLYLSHTQDSKKNPLSYDQKIAYADKAFGDRVEVVNSPAKTIIQVLQELNNEGYTDLIYVGGEDRIGGDEDITATISKYNGQPDKQGNIIYKFNNIEYINAGGRNASSNDFLETVSASMVRELVRKGDFDTFKKCVPFDEATAEELFSDIKVGLNITEEFNENLNEAIDSEQKLISTFIRNILRNAGLKDAPSARHTAAGEIARTSVTTSTTENDIINLIKNNINNEEGVEFTVGNYAAVPAISGTYKSLAIDYSGKTYYLTICSRFKKEFTPNKVLENAIGNKQFVPYESVKIRNLQGLQLQELYNSAVKNAKGKFDYNSTTLTFESLGVDTYDMPEDVIYGILNDFGEVISAGCLAKVMGPGSKVNFPDASNEPLVDFTVMNGRRKIKVSQKAGGGASPSCESAFGLLKDYQNPFFDWMYDNVSTVGIHQGYVNLANLVINNNESWFRNLYDTSKLSKFFKVGSVNAKNVKTFIALMNDAGIKAAMPEYNIPELLETWRIRYFARMAINSMNNSELMNNFNIALADELGSFIQVHLISKPQEALRGDFKFKYEKLTQNRTKYVLLDASAIDKKTCKISVKRLAMKIKNVK